METWNNTAVYTLRLEEIIFANKNKTYGAYVLRKTYKKNLLIACLLAVIVFSVGVSMPLFVKKEIIVPKKKWVPTKPIDLTNINTKDKDAVETPVIRPKTSTIRYTQPVVVEDENAAGYVPTIDELASVNPGKKTIEGSEEGTDIISEPGPVITDVSEPVADKVFLWAEEMPLYPGGDQALLSFIASNIKYPELARKAGVEGKVTIQFEINKNGLLSNAHLTKGIGAGCDEEALRVISLLGKWQPARQNGKPVNVIMSLPILFRLSN